MDRITIAHANASLEELLSALDDAYWDVSTIEQKDILYDLLSSLHQELNEIAKLSIEDHSMLYEPITLEFRNSINKLKKLQSHIEDWFPRTHTAERMENSLHSVLSIVSGI